MSLRADPPRRRTARLGVAVLVLGLVAGLVLAGALVVRRLTITPQERYGAEVVGSRAELSDRLSQGTPDVLITALPIFEDLPTPRPGCWAAGRPPPRWPGSTSRPATCAARP